ncbi:hypothetical protein AZE42_09950 [Rhizopogon vesiculosus]|uniref:Uncharacterized protein n=1 Tax=Rhizopogon vesiculosus TaxID=180088 RepID=A0A1J8QSA3_9AGAM|nr:hypothetical protein AZE42_09950 [Rhizopogon vesiculosus]
MLHAHLESSRTSSMGSIHSFEKLSTTSTNAKINELHENNSSGGKDDCADDASAIELTESENEAETVGEDEIEPPLLMEHELLSSEASDLQELRQEINEEKLTIKLPARRKRKHFLKHPLKKLRRLDSNHLKVWALAIHHETTNKNRIPLGQKFFQLKDALPDSPVNGCL